MKAGLLTALGASLIITSMAVPADAGPYRAKAQRGPDYQMPAGDHATPLKAVTMRVEAPRLVPVGDAELLALKASGVAEGAFGETGDVTIPRRAAASEPDAEYASTSCATNIATGFAPSDIIGAAGPSVLVVTTNVDIGVYNKTTCAINSRVSLKTLFAGFAGIANQTLFDPQVLYDRQSGRFFVTVESRENNQSTSGSGNKFQFQYIAVSTTSGATAWRRWRFRLSDATNRFCKLALNSFWDYPHAGKSNTRWFITANDFPASGSARGAIMSIIKAPTLTGTGSVTARCWNNRNFNIAAPIVLDGSNVAVFLQTGSGSGTVLGRYNVTTGALTTDDTIATGTAFNIVDWTAPPDAVQPNGQRLDSLDGRFQSASIQSRGRIWNIHAVNFGGRSLIRWYRLGITAASPVLTTVTFQSVGDDHLFNPSITTNSGIDGSPAFITASRTRPGCADAACRAAMINFTGPNTTSVGWTQSTAALSTNNFATTDGATSCNNSARGSCRWGDYSSITVDPNDAARAWGFNQLISGTTQFDWTTRGRMEVYNIQVDPAASN